MIVTGEWYGIPQVANELFNTRTGQNCSLKNLGLDTSKVAGGIWDGIPVFCGGHSYWIPILDTCYKYIQSWIPVSSCP